MAFSLNAGKSIYMKISNYCDKKEIQAKHFEYIQFFSNPMSKRQTELTAAQMTFDVKRSC